MFQFPNEDLSGSKNAPLKTNDQTAVDRHDFMVLEKRVEKLENFLNDLQNRKTKGK